MSTCRSTWLVWVVLAWAVLLAACTTTVSGSSTGSSPGEAEETTLPPGATPGLDDFNGDGEPDPTCSNHDYGGGLIVRIPCNYAGGAAFEGTVLAPDSLLGLPGLEIDLTGISGTAVQARTDGGQKLVVLFISADTLFDVGSARLNTPATANVDAIAQLIQNNWPSAKIEVRGHTDATGGAAPNQALSERRAATVADHLAMRGIDRARLSAVGLGSSVPIVLETNADGSDNPTGRQYNRRVELAIVVA